MLPRGTVMFNELKEIDIDLIELSKHRGGKPIPHPTPLDLEKTRLFGLSPIILRPLMGDGSFQRYEILWGEIEWIIAQKIGLQKIQASVRNDFDEDDVSDLINQVWSEKGKQTPINEAETLKRLLQDIPNKNKAELARTLGLKRSTVSHKLQLTTLSPTVKMLAMRHPKRFTAGHLKPLVGLDKMDQSILARRIAKTGLSVRTVEVKAREAKHGFDVGRNTEAKTKNNKGAKSSTSIYPELAAEMTVILGGGVIIDEDEIRINYYRNPEILDGIIQKLRKTSPADDEYF